MINWNSNASSSKRPDRTPDTTSAKAQYIFPETKKTMSTDPTDSMVPTDGKAAIDSTRSVSKEMEKQVVKQVEQDDRIARGADLQKWLVGVGSAIALLVLGGVAHGLLSNRWGVAQDIVTLGQKLSQVPTEIGPWKCTQDSKLDDDVEKMLEAKGHISRLYTHQTTGETINVFVVFGPKGPIAVHTPEVCYSARAVTQTSDRTATPVEPEFKDGALWKLSFKTNTVDERKMNVFYGWSEGGPWQAAANPRFWRTDYLYKIQTSCQATGNKEDSTDEFFKLFLPELRKQMRSVD